jgi:hypothetical protein
LEVAAAAMGIEDLTDRDFAQAQEAYTQLPPSEQKFFKRQLQMMIREMLR